MQRCPVESIQFNELGCPLLKTILHNIFNSMQGTASVAGIDLGTCFSCVYVYKNGTYTIVPIDGQQTIPSVISFYNNQFHYGYPAKESHKDHPLNTFYDVKRMIGSTPQECAEVINQSNYTFQMFENQGYPCYYVCDESTGNPISYITPHQLDASFLQYLVEQASRLVGQEIKDVVITVPAFFIQNQIQATLEAAQIAGLNVMRIMYEPSAAAMASDPDPTVRTSHYIVYDLGGGTFDVAILRVNGMNYDVICNDGHLRLGGQDFDNRLYQYIVEELEAIEIDISSWNKNKVARLRREVENIKITLSTQENYTLDLNDYGYDEEIMISRTQFEACIEDLIDESIRICKRTVVESGIGLVDDTSGKVELGPYDKILLVGGSSAIPLVRSKLIEAFGDRIIQNVNPNTVVARGACIAAIQCWGIPHPCPNPIGSVITPVVHNIVVRSVFIKMNDNEYEEILPRGSPCNEWKSKDVELTFTRFFQKSATVELVTKDENGLYQRLGYFKIKPSIFGNKKIKFELKMNDHGKLCYKYGSATQTLDEGEVDLQSKLDQTTLESETSRFATLKKYEKLFIKARDHARDQGPPYQQVFKNISDALNFIRSPAALTYDLVRLREFCEGYENYIRQALPLLKM